MPAFADLEVGAVVRSHQRRTIDEADNRWFGALTDDWNPLHTDAGAAERAGWPKPLVNAALTMGVVLGLSAADTSEAGGVSLGWEEVRLTAPVFPGDTLTAETEILEKRESASRPGYGVVSVRTRGLNQHGETVIDFRRAFLLPL